MKITNRVLFVFLSTLAVAVLAWLAWQAYKKQQLLSAMYPMVKNSSIRTDESILIQVEPSNITFGEAIAKFTDHISEIDKNIISVQSLEAAHAPDIQNEVVGYQKMGRELLRSMLSETRAAMAVSSAIASEKSAYEDAMGETGYGYVYASKRYKRTVEERKEAFSKWTASSVEACAVAAKMATVKLSLSRSIDAKYLIADAPLKKMTDACQKKAAENDSKSEAATR